MIVYAVLIGGMLYGMVVSGMWFFADLLVSKFPGLTDKQRQRRVILMALLWPVTLVFFGHASVKQAAVDGIGR